jgi:hypothetical protein
MKRITTGKKGNYPDVFFGVVLVVTAMIALIEMRELSSGTASNMGAGYVPRALCMFLLGMGILYVVRGLFFAHYVAMPAVGWKSFGLVCAAIAAFALTLDTLGLFGATLLMTIFASLANKERHWVEMIIFAIGMSAFTVVIFIVGLKLPLPILPVFLGK